jgi:hypothetical protein
MRTEKKDKQILFGVLRKLGIQLPYFPAQLLNKLRSVSEDEEFKYPL